VPKEPVTSVIAAADDEYVEVNVAMAYDSVSPEEDRQISIILMETPDALGISRLTNGAAPLEAVMTLESFSMEETEDEAFRRRLGMYSTSFIGPCTCCKSRHRGLKKAPSIKKMLEDQFNKNLEEQGRH
jgi:hypothetical protein